MEAGKGPVEVAPKKTGAPVIEPKVAGGVTPKEALAGAANAAGWLATISSVKDIVNDIKEGHPGRAALKTGLTGLSFVGEAAPPLFALGAIMNYWGPRHEQISTDAFKAGQLAEQGAEDIPLLGKFETVRRVLGGIAAAETAVEESIAYTVKDMGSAIVEGAEIVADFAEDAAVAAKDAAVDAAEAVGDAAEDAWDWLTSGPSMFDMVEEMAKRERGD